mmetsp:Transcript_3104/g.7389  ORF Transcript_3104/g.7389 Transcript_3104/m.7389 type:complete len:104 (-) Transcript_3104:32-343(-)
MEAAVQAQLEAVGGPLAASVSITQVPRKQDSYFGSLRLDVGVEGAAAGVVDGAVQAALASELGVEVGTIGIMNSTQSGSMLEMDFVMSQYGLRRSLKPPRRHW